MKTDQKIEPSKVTKPIQLLAAWLIGLILVNGSFLTAASILGSDRPEGQYLVIASIINVPLFLIAMFILQTRFRPELQEDIYYSKYLDKKTNQIITVSRDELIDKELAFIRNQLEMLSKISLLEMPSEDRKPRRESFRWKVALNDYLDDFKEIRELLKKEDIPLSEIFGSENTNDQPTERVISFSPRVDFQSKKKVLLLAARIGFKYYDYIDDIEDGILMEDILIGSYSLITEDSFSISPELIALLNSDPDPIDLRYFESKIRTKASDALNLNPPTS